MMNDSKNIAATHSCFCLFIIFVLSLITCISFADAFLQVFAKSSYSILPHNICATNDGYIVIGSIFDDAGPSSWGWVIKVDQNGNKQWERELGRKARGSAFYSVAEDPYRKDFILVGTVNGKNDLSPNASSAGWIVRILPDGNIAWDQSLNLARSTRIMDVKMTFDGNIIAVGRTRENDNKTKNISVDSGFITKIDNKGNILWKLLIKDHWIDLLYILHNGNFIIGGDSWLAMTDPHGNIKWENFLIEKKKLNTITETKGGSLIISGNYGSLNDGSVWIDKLTPNGKLQFHKIISNKEFCDIKAIDTSDENQLVAIGSTCGNVQERIWSATFDIEGALISDQKYQMERNMTIQAILINRNGTFLSVGEKDGKEGIAEGWIFKGNFK